MIDDPMIAALLDGFAAESRDIAQRVTGHILALEGADGDDAFRRGHYDDLARTLHTLKGNAATFGFPHLADLAHKMEDVVGLFRPTLAQIPDDTTDVLLRSVDAFVAKVVARTTEDDDVLRQLAGALAQHGGSTTARRRTLPLPAPPPPRAPEPTTERVADEWRIGARSVEILMQEVERLRELRLRIDERKREVERVLRAIEDEATVDASSMRGSLGSLSHGLGLDGDEANEIIAGLEYELRAIATLPLYSVLEPLPRAVRDLCRALGKEARLAIGGTDIALDRRLLEALKGPLLHLVRNAIDHGIEPPNVRAAAGKPREGSISIRAERTGNLVTLELEDDGGGVDAAKIRDVAIARGIVSAEDAAAMDEHELLQLVFRPAFSTRTVITEISGRGVGLDVVRAAVQALGGRVELHTTYGKGARFCLRLPAALGATPVVVVRVADHVLGIPAVAIEPPSADKPEHARDLGALLALRAAAPNVPDATPRLIVSSHGRRVALAVDEVIGDSELVVRPLPTELHELPYHGAAIYGSGDLLLVVQPEFLVDGRMNGGLPTL